MPRIRTDDLLERVIRGDFEIIKLRGLQSGTFCMVLESKEGSFIHENPDGTVKEYPKVENALTWLKRKTNTKEVVVDIEIWRADDDAK